jgi:hypothetical protein
MKNFALAGTIFVLLHITSFAQVAITNNRELRPITTAVPFLNIAPDSRAGALGDAGTSTSPDANSNRWNAAKFAFIEDEVGFSLSYVPWLRSLVPDISISYLSGFKKINNRQTLSASIFYSNLGDITFTDEQGITLGQFRPNEWALDVGYATKLGDNFSGGITLKYIFSNLTFGQVVQGAQTKPGRAVAGDISFFYTKQDLNLGKNKGFLNAGVNIANLGNKMSYSVTNRTDFLPANIRLGSTLGIQPDDYNSVSFTLEFVKLLVPTPGVFNANNQLIAGVDSRDMGVIQGIVSSFSDAPGVRQDDGSRKKFREELREINPSVGIEYWYDKQFALRAGYFYEHPTKGDRQFFTFGAGLKYNVFGLDISYLIATKAINPLANTLRFTLRFEFGKETSQPKGLEE